MQYKLVIQEKAGMFWAFYCLLEDDPVWNFDRDLVSDKSIKGVLKKARKIKPKRGQIAYTYLDRAGN